MLPACLGFDGAGVEDMMIFSLLSYWLRELRGLVCSS